MRIDDQREHAMPLVSIGLPVYNGENYVRQAIEAILRQTYHNIELIISDNASTDGTGDICREWSARDPRVRYSRNETNIGAAKNYNRVFAQAGGKYFKWAAHDDIMAPTFIERSVAVLESDPDVVLCCPKTHRIDAKGAVIGTYGSSAAWNCESASRRFEQVILTPHSCVIVFGLVRTHDLARTALIAPYVNSDRILLAELALRGRLYEVPEFLFARRDHAGCSIRMYPEPRSRIVWFEPSRRANFSFPEWKEVFGYAGAVFRSRLRPADRLRCWKTVGALAVAKWRPLLADFKYATYGIVGRFSN